MQGELEVSRGVVCPDKIVSSSWEVLTEMSKSKPRQNSEAGFAPSVSTDAIAQRAYALYLARGNEDGHDLEDWIRAERELLEKIASKPSKPRKKTNPVV